MIVHVDLGDTPAGVTLQDPEDCGRFHVMVSGGRDSAHLGAALSAGGVGAPVAGDDEHVWISIQAVRVLAGERVGAGWTEDFSKMLDFAADKGWRDAAGESIKAHIEWST